MAAAAKASPPPKASGLNREGNVSLNIPPPANFSRPAPAVKLADSRPPEAPKPVAAAAKPDVMDLDFDIGTRIAPLSEALDRQENRQEPKAERPDLDFDLGGATLIPHDYDKTDEADAPLDEQALGDDAVEFDVSLTESTFLGRMPAESSVDMASIDLNLHSPDLEIVGLEGQPPSANAVQAPQKQVVEDHDQVSTAVNPDFAAQQMETIVTPPLIFSESPSQSEAAIDPDFGPELMATQVDIEMPAVQSDSEFNFNFTNQQADTIISPLQSAGSDQELDIGSNEEVATKLDLAKAYEEMGDIEGARELLQEVLKDGNASQRETAQSLLDKVGG
jgi:pilus assembly protein FimV